jgi:hypothetical protein
MSRMLRKVAMLMMRRTSYGSPEEEPHFYCRRQVEMWLNHFFMITERLLDVLPMETARMLRLERFSSWYTDKIHSNSPYEEKIKTLLLSWLSRHGYPRPNECSFPVDEEAQPIVACIPERFPQAR